MNNAEFSIHINEVIERTSNVLIKKKEEYAGDKDVFYVFNEGTNISLHTTNVAVGWEFCVKHLQSVKDIINDIEHNKNLERITTDLINEKFGDSINYFILIEGMIKEIIKKKTYSINESIPNLETKS